MGGSLQQYTLRGGTDAASLTIVLKGLWDNVYDVHHWSHSNLCLQKVFVKIKKMLPQKNSIVKASENYR